MFKNPEESGYEIGSGFMVGLRDSRREEKLHEILVEDLLLLKALDCEMAGIGPYIPHSKTPLEQSSEMNHRGSIRKWRRHRELSSPGGVALARILAAEM